MKVAVYYNNRMCGWKIADPKTERNEFLVRTKSCGVCVADTMEWYLTPRAPLTLGHEPAGIVEEVGSKSII